jgi:hypothetical protein
MYAWLTFKVIFIVLIWFDFVHWNLCGQE